MLEIRAYKICSVPVRSCRAEGTIKNVNTVEEYKNLDRAAIMEQAGRTVRSHDTALLRTC